MPAPSSRKVLLGFDPVVAVEHLRGADAVLRRHIDRVGPYKLELQKTTSTFGALAEAIVYQQLNSKAAATIFGRLCALFPGDVDYPEPEQILESSDELLRSAGISRAKTLALQDLARKSVEGTLPTLRAAKSMEDEELIARLVAVRGVGIWTAQMFLMFRLGRPDILPVDDYAIRRGLGVVFRSTEVPTKDVVEKRGRRWSPYRSVASWYLWRALDQPIIGSSAP
jgi:3-methyladenine DNA glycosylase/8-oxoguanine DNA glycosylase